MGGEPLHPPLWPDRQLEPPGRPGKSQKEGQEYQGEVKELGGTPLGLLGSPGHPCLPSDSSLASLEGGGSQGDPFKRTIGIYAPIIP